MTGNTTHQSIRDSIPPSKGQVLKNPALLQGIWAAEGEANATFVINGSKIIYPDSQRSYPFTLSKDTLAILYDDYMGTYLVRIRTPDTLILIGGETQRFYRFKK